MRLLGVTAPLTIMSFMDINLHCVSHEFPIRQSHCFSTSFVRTLSVTCSDICHESSLVTFLSSLSPPFLIYLKLIYSCSLYCHSLIYRNVSWGHLWRTQGSDKLLEHSDYVCSCKNFPATFVTRSVCWKVICLGSATLLVCGLGQIT